MKNFYTRNIQQLNIFKYLPVCKTSAKLSSKNQLNYR